MGNIEDQTDQVLFCLFCHGVGTVRDPVLLREIPCPHCKGEGK